MVEHTRTPHWAMAVNVSSRLKAKHWLPGFDRCPPGFPSMDFPGPLTSAMPLMCCTLPINPWSYWILFPGHLLDPCASQDFYLNLLPSLSLLLVPHILTPLTVLLLWFVAHYQLTTKAIEYCSQTSPFAWSSKDFRGKFTIFELTHIHDELLEVQTLHFHHDNKQKKQFNWRCKYIFEWWRRRSAMSMKELVSEMHEVYFRRPNLLRRSYSDGNYCWLLSLQVGLRSCSIWSSGSGRDSLFVHVGNCRKCVFDLWPVFSDPGTTHIIGR